MKHPSHVILGPYKICITSEVLPEGELGTVDLSTEEMIITPNLPTRVSSLTVLHECLHLVSDIYRLGLTERQIEGLENGIGELICRNQNLFFWLLETLNLNEHNPTSLPPPNRISPAH